MSADTLAGMAADTFALLNLRFAVMVHFHFTGTRTAAHADIFNSSAKARRFMPFKMVQADNNIGIHQRFADFGFFYNFTAGNRDISLVGAL